jgi:hypothetical protein
MQVSAADYALTCFIILKLQLVNSLSLSLFLSPKQESYIFVYRPTIRIYVYHEND